MTTFWEAAALITDADAFCIRINRAVIVMYIVRKVQMIRRPTPYRVQITKKQHLEKSRERREEGKRDGSKDNNSAADRCERLDRRLFVVLEIRSLRGIFYQRCVDLELSQRKIL